MATENKNTVVLYFGSFNPFHIGHAALAKYVANLPYVEQVWFVLSPKNPLKESHNLQDPMERWKDLERVVAKLNRENNLSADKEEKFKACDIEFHLTPPLYTYNTLEKLSSLHPDKNFAILMGGDNIEILHKWHKGEEIARKYKIIVYPREGSDIEDLCKKYGAVCIDAPQIDVSSSQIRQMQQKGEDVSSLRY